MKLDRSHLGKIVRVDTPMVLEVPEGVFKEGDIMVLFNNTDATTTIQSRVKHSYRSCSLQRTMIEFPKRSLMNVVFVADDVVVFTVGF